MSVPRVRPSAAGISVYPNPTTASVRLQLAGVALSDNRVRIVNALGAEVASVLADGALLNFNARSLTDGLYSFVLQTKSGAVSVPFTVLH
jgi:hypothetical protein